jgi:uncharacterized protein (TIGR03083 family)
MSVMLCTVVIGLGRPRTRSTVERVTVALDLDSYLDVITAVSAGIVRIVDTTPLQTMTTTAPEWNLRQLVHHQGEVHRMATAVIAGRCTSFREMPENTLGDLPDDSDLVAWFTAGADRLVDALDTGDDTVDYFTFHPNSDVRPKLRWWARRQAHETAVHYLDACSAVGPLPDVDPLLALDGIDEFLTGFVPRPRTDLHRDVPSRLRLVASDGGTGPLRSWTVTVSPDMPSTVRDDAAGTAVADATVTGDASAMYLAIWNRGGLGALTIEGDASLFQQLRDHVQIRWS